MQPPEWLWSWWENALYNTISWILDIIENIIRMFPEVTTEITVPQTVLNSLDWVGNVLDITAFTVMITVIITYEAIMISVRGILFIWKLTPFS